MHIVNLQHSPVDHPGSFARLFAEDGHQVRTIRVDQGEALPSVQEFDVLWIMGGPQDTWQEQEYPWLKPEKQLIREAVENDIAVLGFCLGAQLLADALGGTVGKMSSPEFGMGDVELTEEGRGDRLFLGLPQVYKTLHWHGAEVKQLPAAGKVLAHTTNCAVQAFRHGKRAYGIQNHMELTEDTVTEWLGYDVYRAGLEATLGREAVADLELLARRYAPNCVTIARVLYRNFMSLAGGKRS